MNFNCIVCKKPDCISESTIENRIKNHEEVFVCQSCSMFLKNVPLEVLIFFKQNNFITYQMFLENLSIKNLPVQITCQYCKKTKIVMSSSLKQRKIRRYEQICNDCYIHHNRLTGFYHGIKFESSYELSFIHACIENDLPIKRCDLKIPYDKNRNYYPDFMINNVIFEVKGKELEHSSKTYKAGQEFCQNNNMLLCFINEDILKQFMILNVNDSNFYKQIKNGLQIINVPLAKKIKNKTTLEKFNYLGYIYKEVDLLNNKTCIKYEFGKVPNGLNYQENYVYSEPLYLFDSLYRLVHFYYEFKFIYHDNYVPHELYIPEVIYHILYRHYNRTVVNKPYWETLTESQKILEINKMKDVFYDLFTSGEKNLLKLNHEERLKEVQNLNNKKDGFSKNVLAILKTSREYKNLFYDLLGNKRKHKSVTKIFNKEGKLLREYLYNEELYRDFDKNTYKIKGLENESYIKLQCKQRKNSIKINLIITNQFYTVEFNSEKWIYDLFGIVHLTYQKILNSNILYNGFYLKSK